MAISFSSQLVYGSSNGNIQCSSSWLVDSCYFLSVGKASEAYNYLLANYSDCTHDLKPDLIWLHIQCFYSLKYYSELPRLIKSLAAVVPADDPRLLHVTLQFLIKKKTEVDFKAVLPSSKLDFYFSEFPHILISAIESCLLTGNISLADSLIERLPLSDSLFVLIIHAKVQQAKKNHLAVESILLPRFDRYIYDSQYCELLINSLFFLRREALCLPILRKSLEYHHTLNSSLLSRFAEAKLLQRQPADGLRFKLLERVNSSLGYEQQSPTCLSTAYDLLGRCEWFEYTHPEIIQRPGMAAHLASNLMMHCSSQALSPYPLLAKNLISFLRSQWYSLGETCVGPCVNDTVSATLKIGWILGDVCNHPVFRFIYSFFYSSQGNKKHNHYVVSTHPMNLEYAEMLTSLSDVSLIDFSHISTMPEQLHAIRSKNFDVVVDLNGWTANNIAPVFLARVAPIQVNYLAYHATSGLSSMDAWIVDDNLIPIQETSQEWHTEKIVRLSRPFLAWNPPSVLPEGKINNAISIAFDQDSPIRFGSFNNLRKISDACLDLWSKLLERIPDCTLVLKAFASEDANTEYLIKQRFAKAKIDVNRIHFLPFTSTPHEHLMQYAYLDVALDSFPNTGCTTTCEALWMGVPVITLRGQQYVTRMAHSVLCGAGLSDWSFSNTANFLDFAESLSQQKRLKWLRLNRSHWRQMLVSSPLGDSNDLICHLEDSFSKLYNGKVSSLSNNAEL